MYGDMAVPVWLEFHDLHLSNVVWEGTVLRIPFRFGTVYDERYSHFG